MTYAQSHLPQDGPQSHPCWDSLSSFLVDQPTVALQPSVRGAYGWQEHVFFGQQEQRSHSQALPVQVQLDPSLKESSLGQLRTIRGGRGNWNTNALQAQVFFLPTPLAAQVHRLVSAEPCRQLTGLNSPPRPGGKQVEARCSLRSAGLGIQRVDRDLLPMLQEGQVQPLPVLEPRQGQASPSAWSPGVMGAMIGTAMV